jgi:hypothetical protein
MFEVADVFTFLVWLLLCGNLAVIGFAALVEFGPRRSDSVGSLLASGVVHPGGPAEKKSSR